MPSYHILNFRISQSSWPRVSTNSGKKGFSHVSVPCINCSVVLPADSIPGNSQATSWLKAVQTGELKQWPSWPRTSLREKMNEQGEGWRRLVRRYSIVRLKIRMDGVLSFLRSSYKIHLWWSRRFGLNLSSRLWLLPVKASTNPNWWNINLLAFYFLFSLSVGAQERAGISYFTGKITPSSS